MKTDVRPVFRRSTVIEPPRAWRSIDIGELLSYRELFLVLTMRDIRIRYKQTALGFAWAILQPLMMMAVFSIFFGRLAKIPSDGLPYPAFIYCGLLIWMFFSNSVGNASGSLVGSANLLSKVYFPRLILPLAAVGVALVDLAVAGALLSVILLYFGLVPGIELLALPLVVAGVAFFAVGVGAALSALTVTYRDFRFVTPFLMQIWLFATPVVYPSSLVPESWRWALYLNPMAGYVEAFRACVFGTPIDAVALAVACVVSLATFAGGIFYFEKVERNFADVI